MEHKKYWGYITFGFGISTLAAQTVMLFGHPLSDFWQSLLGGALIGVGALLLSAKQNK